MSSTSMAVHTVRSPATHLHTGTSRNISPSHRNPNAAIRLSYRSPKLRRFISVSSSLREGNEHGKENSVRALEVTKIPEESPLLPSLSDAAAVASAKAAEIYGLSVVAEDIQDDSDNVTRFLMLAREPIIPGTNKLFKTSIVFSLEEGPGVLFKALAVFALRQINLTKMESRPLRKTPLRASGGLKYFDYLFYVDFEASMADEVAQNALRHLELSSGHYNALIISNMLPASAPKPLLSDTDKGKGKEVSTQETHLLEGPPGFPPLFPELSKEEQQSAMLYISHADPTE
ncbi:hypothetical protein F2Q68_00002730 [Brassica cretica]|uniref:Arogenate dehydratase n=1 Tax=Brassica cretica TaxID=69181 RepID=A0A8S9J6B2_BRACR|nr:hypothetical protein F2Q68_00002730 [Brassica cretica]